MERRSQLILTPHLPDMNSTLRVLVKDCRGLKHTTAAIKDKWRRGDEAMRGFTGTWFNKRKERWILVFQQVPVLNTTSQNTSKVKLNDYNKSAEWEATHY